VSRENAPLKGRRLLTEGRVSVVDVRPDRVRAVVRGDSAQLYTVGYDPSVWTCSCAALTACSHVKAVQLVVIVDGETAS